MNKLIDCGTCHYGQITSPKMITCNKMWPWKYHRRSFGENCWDWTKRVNGRKYYDYGEPDDKVWHKE
jgi:hypothetical protein